MSTNQELNYHLYVQKTHGFIRTPFNSEFEKYMIIRSGDVDTVKRNFEIIKKDFLKGKGILSEDPVRNVMYHFVTSVALTSRICVEGGMSHDTAYTLSDIYIQKADKCTSDTEIIDMLGEMQVDFAERMKELKKEDVISLHVRKSIDYIYENLHKNLSIKDIAEFFGLNPSYLSKLFLKETGITIKDFVTNAKIRTAENMLKYSDFSYLDISLAMGFSSQSAFISVFKKVKGITPKKYREQFYMSDVLTWQQPG